MFSSQLTRLYLPSGTRLKGYIELPLDKSLAKRDTDKGTAPFSMGSLHFIFYIVRRELNVPSPWACYVVT